MQGPNEPEEPEGTDGSTAEVPPRPPEAEPAGEAEDQNTWTLPTGRASRMTRPSQGSGLVDVPEVPYRDPTAAILRDPSVRENKRFCSTCGHPVGRRTGDVPGATEGECPEDGTPFSFRPKLAPGDVLAGQYEVAGCIAHGGLGWIYLAKDRNVGDREVTRWVAVKGLLAPTGAGGGDTVTSERRFLASLDHPNIVKILNFAEHDGDGYIVMEYVGGVSLRDERRERWRSPGRGADPFPAALACEYILQSLPALAYLHERALAYCDFKPDNLIRTPHAITLIDLGAVCRIGASHSVFGTPGYQAPEVEERGPSVASDLFTVARTLAELCSDPDRFSASRRSELPDPGDVPAFDQHDALYRFLRKGTAADPEDRFRSAEEMSEQLTGVLRELVAGSGDELPFTSRLFTTDLRARPDAPDPRLLPRLRVPSEDPASGYLESLEGTEGDTLLELLDHAPTPSREIDLRKAATLIEAARWDEAERELASISSADPRDWRVAWYRGVAALTQGDPATATEHFSFVYREVPGELAPKLAMGVASETAGDWSSAIARYDVVSRTDPSFSTAAFGLARARAEVGDRDGWIAAYLRVPERSISYDDAQLERGYALVDPDLGDGPSFEDLIQASRTLDTLGLEEPLRDGLRAAILETALMMLADGRAEPVPEMLVGGSPMTELDLRRGLEDVCRRLARGAATTEERYALVDRANEVRPRTLT